MDFPLEFQHLNTERVEDLDILVNYVEDYEVSYSSNEISLDKSHTIKFDSACSRNMSGVISRTSDKDSPLQTISVRGFNNTSSSVDSVGVNDDGKLEYYVSSMPPDLVLLSAHDYVQDGAAILLPDKGVVLSMDADDRAQLMNYLRQYHVLKSLKVKNRTYEVDTEYNAPIIEVSAVSEEAFNSTATRYFNTSVHVSNEQERVLAMLLTGLSFKDLYSMRKNDSVEGLPRDLTLKSLNFFEHRYGRTPNALQLALPSLAGNRKGYMAPPDTLQSIGQRVEVDYFKSEFNWQVTDKKTGKQRQEKIPTFGGAIDAYVSVDVYSGMMHGRLVNSLANSVVNVKWTVDTYKTAGHSIRTFAADMGVISQSMFQVSDPNV